ncbi:MAG: M48 family metalloprotease [Planctomycetota bacterium]|jgi:STE24 endopeptidase
MEEVTTKAKQYSRSKTRLTVVQLVMTLLFLLIMLVCGASLALKELVAGWSQNYYVQLGLYLVIFGGIYQVLFVWLEFYGGFLLEHKYLLSNQTVLGWMMKNAKKGLLSLLIFLPAMEALYFFLRNFPKSWWLLTTGGWLLLSVVLGRIMPTVIIPLFYKCKPIANTDLKERLLNLGRSCGVMIKDVFEIKFSKDTKKANAAIAGFGKGRRVLLGDTLLGDCSEEEIEAVFAHELGHIRLLHTWKIFGFGAVISLVSFYFTFVLFEAGTSVLAFEGQLWYSRHLEKRADIFAVEHIENPQSFASVMTKLASQNLIDTSPSRLEEVLLHDHPSISKRLSYINGEAKPEPQ